MFISRQINGIGEHTMGVLSRTQTDKEQQLSSYTFLGVFSGALPPPGNHLQRGEHHLACLTSLSGYNFK